MMLDCFAEIGDEKSDMVRELYAAKKARTTRSSGMFDEQKWVGGRMGYTL